jgi:CHAD domain-containing protein
MENQPSTLGDYAHAVIQKQFHHLIKQKRGVLADQDPEYLHQMRVGTRRLQAALQTFSCAVELPKAAHIQQVRALGKILGQLRDLDVQTAAIQAYIPDLEEGEKALAKPLETRIALSALKPLQHHRAKAFTEVQFILTHSRYKKIKAAYQNWLDHPHYTALAPLPLVLLIPDLLNPLLSALLLHPGWLVQDPANPVLHDLRKLCKAVRYQAEFFTDFYKPTFQDWVNELKTLQDHLGQVQDGYVLLKMLPHKSKLPGLQAMIHQQQNQAMENWEAIRCQYLSSDFRQRLRRMILNF